MNHYEECTNAMWAEVEGKKQESVHQLSQQSLPLQLSDEERWKEFVEKYSHSGYLVQSEIKLKNVGMNCERNLQQIQELLVARIVGD